MSFLVVQTRKSKKSKPSLTVVPAKWVKDKVVYWPLNNIITLSKNKDSIPDENAWKQQQCKVVAKAATYDKAEDTMQKLEMVTDSEDAIQMTTGTRLHPPKKKPKFVSKAYQLAAPLRAQSTSQLIVQDSGTLDHHLATPDITIANEEYDHAKEPESAAHHGSPDVGHASSPGSIVPAASNEQNLPMWNIQNIEGRQYLRATDGSYVEISVQATDDQLMSDAVEIQPTSTYRILAAESQPITGTQPFNTEGLHIVRSQVMNEMELQSVNTTGMQFANEAENLVNTEEDQLFNTGMQQIKGDHVESEYFLQSNQQYHEILTRLDRIEPVLEQLVFFMADVKRFMQMKSSDQTDQVEITKKRKLQDYSEYEELFPIDTEDQLLTLESSLKNSTANDKLFGYFESVYNLNGKRDSGPFFKTLLRKTLVPTTIQAFSWKGQSRCNKGSVKTENKSFKDTFPSFVKFVHRVVRAADFEFTEEANNDAFGVYLRNKNTEIQRHEKGSSEQRVARVSRKRPPKPAIAESAAAEDSETTDIDAKSYDTIASSISPYEPI